MSDQDQQSQDAYDHYSMIIEWKPGDQFYIVTIPALPECRTHGATVEESVRQGRDAMESWIDTMRYWGRPIPPPKFFDFDVPNPPAGATNGAARC